MENPAFIGINDIQKTYLPMGFSNFKIEGRGLGSADFRISPLLYDKAGASAAGPGGHLPGQHAGPVLTIAIKCSYLWTCTGSEKQTIDKAPLCGKESTT